MKILALDTTAKAASVALAEASDDGTVSLLGQFFLKTTAHSATLIPMAGSLLSAAGLDYPDLGLLAVSAGPGSFTGIRIGVATLKGMALPWNTPAVGVSSLEALAWGCADLRGFILPAVDARRGTVYGAVFRSDGKGCVERITEDAQPDWEEYRTLVREITGGSRCPVYGCGDGWLVDAGRRRLCRLAPEELRYPTGLGVARAAYRRFRDAKDPAVFTGDALVPTYLKKSQAERDREISLRDRALV